MGGRGEKMAFINPLASTAIMLMSYAPKTPDEIVADPKEVTRGPMMYPASVFDSVPFQMTVGLDAVPENTEEQAAEEIKRLIMERDQEARRFEIIKGGLRANTITLAPVRYAVDPPENKPRSKRGQRGRRWR